MSGVKITAADKWFSKCVRQRANWCCERCGNDFTHKPGGLDCSHHHGRRNWSIRFNPLNAEALCYGCHSHHGGTEERRKEVLTEQEIDLLFELKRDVSLAKEYRRTKGVGEISKHYREEYRRMVDTGDNNFEAYI
jgi:hypothetical protein